MTKSTRAALSESHLHQIAVLKTMSAPGAMSSDPRPFDITELAALTGFEDDREVQRYLYILEGQKLVAPYPEGDFTSKTWLITKHGLETLRSFERMGMCGNAA